MRIFVNLKYFLCANISWVYFYISHIVCINYHIRILNCDCIMFNDFEHSLMLVFLCVLVLFVMQGMSMKVTNPVNPINLIATHPVIHH